MISMSAGHPILRGVAQSASRQSKAHDTPDATSAPFLATPRVVQQCEVPHFALTFGGTT